MGTENIRQKVLQSAEAEAERILSDARRQAAERVAAAKSESEARIAAETEVTRRSLGQQHEEQITAQRAANKLKLLELKGAILNDVFHTAVKRFVGDRTGDYAAWLARQLAMVEGMEGRIVPSAADRGAIESWFSQHRADRLELASESTPIRGGFLLEGAQVNTDFSLDTRLAEIRAELLPELARKAFSSTD